MLALQLKVHVSNARNLPKDGQARFYMFVYLLDAICAQQQFPGMGWTWTPLEEVVNVYCKLLSKCSYRGVMTRLSDHFIAPLYKMIFEQDLPCMSQEAMQALLNIADWYASLGGTFIRMFGMEKPLHELPRFATDKLVIQEVAYHISTGLLATLHMRKKTPWSTLPLRIGLYEIRTLKDANVETKDLKKFGFDTKSFNPYDPHCICKNHCVKVYFPWVHGACYWLEEDL